MDGRTNRRHDHCIPHTKRRIYTIIYWVERKTKLPIKMQVYVRISVTLITSSKIKLTTRTTTLEYIILIATICTRGQSINML